MKTLEDFTNKSVLKIRNHAQFALWAESSKYKPSDIVLINNSFVLRDVYKSKSPYYLAMKVGQDGSLINEVYVASGIGRINKDFKLIQSRQPNIPVLVPLKEAFDGQLSEIGQIVFALIGRIESDIPVELDFKHAQISKIVLNPSQVELLIIDGDVLKIKETINEEELWGRLESSVLELGIEVPPKLKTEFGTALDKLQSKAVARLSLPVSKQRVQLGLTDSIVENLKSQRDEYKQHINAVDISNLADNPSFNEILRLAYNFSRDALTYFRLIVSICDLKPIIMWTTIGEHYYLSEAFRDLPWARSKYKASMKNYIDTVSDARNRRFHDAFPFSKALRISIPSAAVQDAEIQIFSEFTGRTNLNEFTFRDKALVDILLEFTRARDRPVPTNFWEKNISVMDRMIELFDSTSRSLKLIHSIKYELAG